MTKILKYSQLLCPCFLPLQWHQIIGLFKTLVEVFKKGRRMHLLRHVDIIFDSVLEFAEGGEEAGEIQPERHRELEIGLTERE